MSLPFSVVPPILRFEHAALGFGSRAVLTGVNFQIERGAFVGILGPNGAGKTTLLKTLLGLLSPLRGRFETEGSDNGRPRFGYVPQKERLDPIYPLSAYEVASMGTYRRVELFRRLRGNMHDEIVRRGLRASGALELAHRRYSDLSGGQKQRVLIARALASEPEVLILDEPLAGIDVATQKALLKLFHELKAEGRLTVLMVSHRLQTERELFSDVLWVDDGKVDAGPAASMLAKAPIMEFFGREP